MPDACELRRDRLVVLEVAQAEVQASYLVLLAADVVVVQEEAVSREERPSVHRPYRKWTAVG